MESPGNPGRFSVFDASERYPPIDRLVDDFNTAIDQSDVPTAAAKLARIEKEVMDDTPTLLVLWKRLKKLRDDNEG